MDSIQQIAISQIADVLSKGNLVRPQHDIWKRIFYNAGQSEVYNENRNSLQSRCNEDFQRTYRHDERCYSALLEIFSKLVIEFEEFTKVINRVLDTIIIDDVFSEEIYRQLARGVSRFEISHYLKTHDFETNLKLLDKYPSSDFTSLRSSLNVLGLDTTFDRIEKSKLVVLPFVYEEKDENKTVLSDWLETHYPIILKNYQNARKMYGLGHPVECLVDCRNVITGIFSNNKREQTRWYTGLKTACKNDRNILNIADPKIILTWNNGQPNNPDVNKRYNYPRFKTIGQVYSFLSDLGAHQTEGNIVNGAVDYEEPTLHDALMGLRLTEDILIWLYQNQENDL